jgi:pyruvate formate lyase activating enzyme
MDAGERQRVAEARGARTARHRHRAADGRARRLARANGLRYVYLGNVHDPTAGTTACPGCGARVLVRDGYQVVRSALDERGRCFGCATTVPGRFDGPVGRWGPRRLPVRVVS